MPPTNGADSTGDQSQAQDSIDTPTVPIALPRKRRADHRRRLHLTLRRPRPSTVWPCAQDELREGTGLIAQWLLTVVIKIVTTYSQPGHRVLLLDPAPFSAPPASASATGVLNRSHRGSYVGLLEACWPVVRLGRSVQSHAVVTHPNRIDDTPVDTPAESESGPRLPAVGPSTDHSATPPSDHRLGSDPEATGHQSDRFDLIITAAEPGTLDYLRPTDWASLLTPTGTLAVITHGDRSTGLLNDPAGPLVRAARHAGLSYTDRIAVLRVPVRDGALTVASPAVHDRSQASTRPPTVPIRHIQVHDDLLVFSRHAAPRDAADGEETSDA
ncbi:hypothetical protein [Lentzea albidocapillata]|uniref:Uncharacterized protein n=1 Tax=Lentzea albidocapillata TaxID=40571 RepID=A0A1W2FQS1_9PSEU|nr:hypothetical protein [Lentzea albidocapillata]SMD23948.1 hypothetical protein SAMN05660733_07478 [Lentzea albidocapillata]